MLNKLNAIHTNYNTHEQIMFNPRINLGFVSFGNQAVLTEQMNKIIWLS